VCVCVRARARAEVCIQFLFFLGFLFAVKCAVAGHLLPPEFYWLQGFMCVCAQVGFSVVCY
jgi:hypothetical protein